MSQVKITTTFEVDDKDIEVDIYGAYEQGDSSGGHSNGGWYVEEWECVNLEDITLNRRLDGIVNELVHERDWDFEKQIEQDREDAILHEAGL